MLKTSLFFLLALVLIQAVSGSKRAEYIAVGFHNNSDVAHFERDHGFRMLHRIGYLPGNYYHMVRDPWHPNGTTEWSGSRLIHWGEEQFPEERYKKGGASREFSSLGSPLPQPSLLHTEAKTGHPRADPLLRQQFHLGEMHVDDVWRDNHFYGRGVVVGVVDDGLQYTHPDLRNNYDASLSWDYFDHDPDPIPNPLKDEHGTPCSGLVGAVKDNGVCGAGVAPQVSLAGIRLIGGRISDAQEAGALSHLWDRIHIYTCSWGWSDVGVARHGPGSLVQQVFEQGVVHGRGGKGSIWVWAGGNGRANGDYANWDGMASSRYTIGVAAATIRGQPSWYSERGSSLLVCAPSSGAGVGVVTVDLLGLRGYGLGSCTDRFGGTSAATPMVVGVIALLLEMNPDLGWRDVQAILLRSANSDIEKNSSEWKVNGAGRRVSHDHGYGLVDARAAILLGDPHSWAILPPQDIRFLLVPPEGSLPRHFRGHTEFTYRYSNRDFIVEHVELRWQSRGIRTGDLFLSLHSPTGTRSHLSEWNIHNNMTRVQEDPFVFTSVFHWDESPYGTWRLDASLFYGQEQEGEILEVSLWLYGRRHRHI